MRLVVRRALGVVVVAVAFVGCGAASDDVTSRSSDTATSSDAAFPVTIAHRHGSTTIDHRPERIVTVGLTDQDALFALGQAPVGVTEWFGDRPGAVMPWAEAAAGARTPEIIGDTQGLNFEAIAALAPDLIVGLYAGLSAGDYDKLRQIAPTVAQPADHVDFGIPWDELTLTMGRLVGEPDLAAERVDAVHAQIDAARLDHPDFDGATGLVAVPSPASRTISVYAPDDVRGRLLTSLGFVQPPEIAELAGDQFSADLSYERIDVLDVDALVWIVGSLATDVPQFDAEPLYANLPVHTGHHDVFVENLGPTGMALSFVSVLSLPGLLDDLVPQLAAAVAGLPA